MSPLPVVLITLIVTVFFNWFNGCFISFDRRFNLFNGSSIAINVFFIAINGSAIVQIWSEFEAKSKG